MAGDWYIKTHDGEELGPYKYQELLDLLESPPYSENATLIRPEWRDSWKPALIEIPTLMEHLDESAAESDHESVVPEPITEKSPTELQQLSLHIRQSRFPLLCIAIIALIGATAFFLKLLDLQSGHTVGEPLANSNQALFCAVVFIFPISALWKMAYTSFQLQLPDDTYIRLFLAHMQRFWFTLLFAIGITITTYCFTTFS